MTARRKRSSRKKSPGKGKKQQVLKGTGMERNAKLEQAAHRFKDIEDEVKDKKAKLKERLELAEEKLTTVMESEKLTHYHRDGIEVTLEESRKVKVKRETAEGSGVS